MLPLDGVRVVDLADAKGEACARLLADLGADVVRVEPPGGALSRRLPPFANGTSLFFAVRNANKRGVVIDLETPDGRDRLLDLAGTADILIESARPGTLEQFGIGPDDLLARNPQLVVTSITDFGQTGPYRGWLGTDAVVGAMSGILDRSGVPGLPPLVPPGAMAYETSAMQAAWATLAAYRNRLRTGCGDHVDLSIVEAAGQTMDPDWSAVPPTRPGIWVPPYGRVRSGLYPILPCADGFVRIVVLAPWQWRRLRAWLGEPEELQDPALDTVPGRQAAEERLNEILGEFFRDRTKQELCEGAQSHGIALGPVLGIREVLAAEQFRSRGALVDAEVAPGLRGRVPAGCVEVDGARLGFIHRAPEPGEHDGGLDWLEQPPPRPPRSGGETSDGPLSGIRIVDFGAIVIGNEIGRLFADLGAEVIKIECRAYPDAVRAVTGFEMNPIFAAGGRNKKSFGVNLRTPDGVELLKRLVATADIVAENFKPGTLEGLGLGYEVLRELKPDVVFVSTNAVGATGPWRSWLGYGPIVRSVSGITSLWRYPGEDGIHCDQTTIYPDHYAARIVAATALAALLRRDRTGEGARVDCAQAEATLYQLADVLLAASLGDERVCEPAGNGSDRGVPWGIYPCLGDDAWCVVTVEDDEQWTRLADELEWGHDPDLATLQGRQTRRTEIDDALSRWTAALPPREAMERLQAAGVPAGMMMDAADRESDPHLVERGARRLVDQPALGMIPMENAPFRSRAVQSIPLRPAPFHGQHTREICTDLLGLDEAEIERLIESGVLEEPLPEHRSPAASAT